VCVCVASTWSHRPVCVCVASTWSTLAVTVVRYKLVKSPYRNNQSDIHIEELSQLAQKVQLILTDEAMPCFVISDTRKNLNYN